MQANDGASMITIGSCDITTTDMTCTITSSGTVAQDAPLALDGTVAFQVSSSAPSGAVVARVGVSVPSDWTGNDPTNDTFKYSTTAAGDWGTDGSGTAAPGRTLTRNVAWDCLSDDGCAIAPSMVVQTHAANGGSYTPDQDVPLYAQGVGLIGSCEVTTTAMSCTVTENGHAEKGALLWTGLFTDHVAADAPAEKPVFTSTVSTPDWPGADASNDSYVISTPPVAGSPMASGEALGAIGGAATLLLGLGLWIRRRRQGSSAAAV